MIAFVSGQPRLPLCSVYFLDICVQIVLKLDVFGSLNLRNLINVCIMFIATIPVSDHLLLFTRTGRRCVYSNI